MTGAELITQHVHEDWQERQWTYEHNATGLQRKLAARIDAALAKERERAAPFVAFWTHVSDLFFVDESVDLDYQDFLDHAEAVGLLVQVPFNPDTHGDVIGDPEPGDSIYVRTPLAAAILTDDKETTDG